jgi:GntR family transcriptional repressor for pyruvate dehydrogenase complex
VDQLRSLILTGTYPPSAKLPPERELAKQMRVNRASLREALKKLEHLGLVTIRQGDGTRVANFMETAGIELVTHLIPLAQRNYPGLIREVLEFRWIYARDLVRLAAMRRDLDDLQRLRQLAQQARDESLSQADVFLLDFEFYMALATAAKNRVMGLLVNRLRETVKSFAAVLADVIVTPELVREHHAHLLDALEAGDVDRAVALIDDYMKRGHDHVLALFDQGRFDLLKR